MALLRVDGVDMPEPSRLQWSLQDVSVGDSGRDDSGKMYKGRITQKVKLEIAWNAVSPSSASTILNAFNPEYINVRYFDPKANAYQVKNFYVGDRAVPFKIFTSKQKMYETLSFDIIER